MVMIYQMVLFINSVNILRKKQPMSDQYQPYCFKCADDIDEQRWMLGYRVCMHCGEIMARGRKHTIVPMAKSNYVVVTNLDLLKGLNKYAN